jgi:DNA-binding transcriptional LysR family regulator
MPTFDIQARLSVLDQLQSLRVFCRVAELESFTAAAERLGISTAAASKHLQQLEQRLGVRLLHRSSRKVSLTDSGRAYWESVQAILEDLEEADLAVAAEAHVPAGRLRLTAPSWFGSEPFAAVVREFRAQYPAVQLDLDLSDGMVDIVDQGLDLALRVTRHLQTSLLSRYLGPVHFHLVAAPSLLPRNLTHPSSLQGFPWLEYSYVSVEGLLPIGPESVQLEPVLHSNSTLMIYQAARAGLGVAILPRK